MAAMLLQNIGQHKQRPLLTFEDIMKQLKFLPDQIFCGTQFLEAGLVLICSNDGTIADIVSKDEAGDEVQTLTGILSPGFVNCHCHLELSHMKGLIEEQRGLVDFVFSVVMQRHFPEEEILDAITKADEAMYANGTQAVGDICNNLLTLSQKEDSKLRYYNFVETSGWLPDIAALRFERSKLYYDVFAETFATSMVPHAPYSVSENLWQLIQPLFKSKTVSIHNQETAFEDDLFVENSGDFVRMYELMKMDTSFFKATGKSSLQSYFAKLKEAANVLLVHNTFIKQADIDFIKSNRQNEVWFCLCPNANLYIENALPPVNMLRQNNCNMVIGTDSLASNHSLSVLEEMKTLQAHFPAIFLQEMLTWATHNGAKALQMDDELGRIEKGKKPGLVLIENAFENKLMEDSFARRIV